MSVPFLDTYLPYVLRQADQTLSAPFYGVLNQYGVARSEWRVLAVLHDLGEMGVIELSTAALSPQPTVTHAVRRLEERGLVTRTPGATDKRQRVVAMTEGGTALTATLVAEAKRLEVELLDEAGELTSLIDQLRTLTANIEARAITREQAEIEQTEEAV